MLYLYRSNRLERLAEALAGVVRRPAGPALEPEIISVQGQGMERWVSMELARRLGVWANPDFPFPRNLLERLIGRVLGDEDRDRADWEPVRLQWWLASILPGCLEGSEFRPLARWVGGGHERERGRRLVELCQQLSRVFDSYAMYRPEMVLSWQQGGSLGADRPEDRWQPLLWRRLCQQIDPGAHLAARVRAAVARLSRGAQAQPLPARVSLFGLTTLPPLLLQLYASLAERMELYLFQSCPTQEFLGHLGPEEPGHPLLLSMGKVARDMQQLLEQHCALRVEEDLWEPPGEGCLLHRLQTDLLELRPPTPGPMDASVELHSCHSPLREAEVLRERILAALEEDRKLQPRDVVVMMPDVERYAPAISAVFHREPPLPHRIADRDRAAVDPGAAALRQLIRLTSSRLTAPAVVDLLTLEPIRLRFGVAVEDLDAIRGWVEAAFIRWGQDRGDRRALGLPPFDQNSWRAGLHRLLLGVAVGGPEEEAEPWLGVLPLPLEGIDQELLGRFVDCVEAVFSLRAELQGDLPGPALAGRLAAAVDRFLAGDVDEQPRLLALRAAFADLSLRMEAVGFRSPVEAELLVETVLRELAEVQAGAGFLSAGVTLCALRPLRSIPFQVVAIIGLEQATFPRPDQPLPFDLAALRRVPGDRNARDDDRMHFVESLASARRKLILSWVGQSIQDDGERPASPVVAELMDVLLAMDERPRSERGPLVVRHPLQPFSPAAFDPSVPLRQSSDRVWLEGARALLAPAAPPAPFLAAELPPEEGVEIVQLDELARFWSLPCRGLLERRLGLRPGEEPSPLSDAEPLVLDPLEEHALGSRLLAERLADRPPEELLARLEAEGRLPPGVPGRVLVGELLPRVEELARQVRALSPPGAAEQVSVDLQLGPLRIVGAVGPVQGGRRLLADWGRLRERQVVRRWVEHLALCAMGEVAETVLVGRGQRAGAEVRRLRPSERARGWLEELAQLWLEGRRRPLPFFPEASAAYVRSLLRRGDERAALHDARRAFGGEQPHDEAQDATVLRCFGADALAEPSFPGLAQAVYGPLLECLEGP